MFPSKAAPIFPGGQPSIMVGGIVLFADSVGVRNLLTQQRRCWQEPLSNASRPGAAGGSRYPSTAGTNLTLGTGCAVKDARIRNRISPGLYRILANDRPVLLTLH